MILLPALLDLTQIFPTENAHYVIQTVELVPDRAQANVQNVVSTAILSLHNLTHASFPVSARLVPSHYQQHSPVLHAQRDVKLVTEQLPTNVKAVCLATFYKSLAVLHNVQVDTS